MKKLLGKNLIGIIALAVLLGCAGLVYGSINTQSPDRGQNPLTYENPDHKEVFPEGKGYSLSKAKAQEYQLPEKNQQQQSIITGSASSSVNSSFSSTFFSRSYSRNRTFTTSKIDMTPTVKTDLAETPLKKGTVGGDAVDFYIEPRLYGGTVPDVKDFTVTYEGKELKGKKSGTSSFLYSVTLKTVGKNKITITVNDTKRKKTLTKEYYITGVKKSPEETKTYDVTCSCDLSMFGGDLPALTSYKSSIEEGEKITVREALTAMLKAGKFTMTETEDRITKISGFNKDTQVIFSDDEMDKIREAWPSYANENLNDKGAVEERTFDSASTGSEKDMYTYWKVYKYDSEKKKIGAEMKLSDKISSKQSIILRYEYGEKQ